MTTTLQMRRPTCAVCAQTMPTLRALSHHARVRHPDALWPEVALVWSAGAAMTDTQRTRVLRRLLRARAVRDAFAAEMDRRMCGGDSDSMRQIYRSQNRRAGEAVARWCSTLRLDPDRAAGVLSAWAHMESHHSHGEPPDAFYVGCLLDEAVGNT